MAAMSGAALSVHVGLCVGVCVRAWLCVHARARVRVRVRVCVCVCVRERVLSTRAVCVCVSEFSVLSLCTQARILEQVVIAFFRGSSPPRD